MRPPVEVTKRRQTRSLFRINMTPRGLKIQGSEPRQTDDESKAADKGLK